MIRRARRSSRGGPRSARRGIRVVALAALSLAVPAALTACSTAVPLPTPPPGVDAESFDGADGNGLWLVSSSELEGLILEAVHDAGPVSMRGTVHEFIPSEEGEPLPGRTIGIEYAGRPSGFTAHLTAGDVDARLLVDAGGTRVLGNAAYATASGRPELSSVQCTLGTDPAVAQWAPLTDPAAVLETLLSGAELSVAPPEGDGDTLAVQIGSAESVSGVLTVERFGPPLPRSLSYAAAEGDTELAFEGWGEPVDLDAAAAELPCG